MQCKINSAVVIFIVLGCTATVLAASSERTPAFDRGATSGRHPVANRQFSTRCTTAECDHGFVALATYAAATSLHGRPPALSTSDRIASARTIASIAQSEASSVTAHGGGTTLQECMTLWDAATHMTKQEWKAACKRSMVVEFPEGSP